MRFLHGFERIFAHFFAATAPTPGLAEPRHPPQWSWGGRPSKQLEEKRLAKAALAALAASHKPETDFEHTALLEVCAGVDILGKEEGATVWPN